MALCICMYSVGLLDTNTCGVSVLSGHVCMNAVHTHRLIQNRHMRREQTVLSGLVFVNAIIHSVQKQSSEAHAEYFNTAKNQTPWWGA